MKLIESETRYPGAPLADPGPLDTVGLQLSPKATEDLRRFATSAMGQGDGKGGDSAGNSPSSAVAFDSRGGGPLSKGGPRPDSPQQRLLDVLVPRETAEEALRVYDRHLLGDQGPVYALQQAFVYIAEAGGWRRHLRGGG